MSLGGNKTTFRKLSGSFSHCPTIEHPNFEDPNLNVTHPILTIHGNHDDPTGPNNQSVCEKLATSGLLNYFGFISLKSHRIEVKPIVFEKDGIKLAIYGMGFLPDGRLKIAFEKNEVVFGKPPKNSFNILVTHQNRATVNKDRYIPDDYYPDFFHLIIRGHEHEAQAPQKITNKVKGIVWQPGSTVATSINFMESLPKKVGIVEVTKIAKSSTEPYTCDIKLIELKSIRPMIVKNIYREDIIKYAVDRYGPKAPLLTDKIFIYSRQYAEITLTEALKDCKKGDMLPLVRIRIEYILRDERFDDNELIMKNYNINTANKDIILFRKRKSEEGSNENITFKETSSLNEITDDFDDFERINLSQEKRNTIDSMIENYFNDLPYEQRLIILSLKEYTEAVSSALEDGNVIGKVVKDKVDKTLKEYESIIHSEDIAEEHFKDESSVMEWFVSKLRSTNIDFDEKQGGDRFEESY